MPRYALISVGLALWLLALWLAPARAHGDAEWIQRGGYTDPVSGEHCCGVNDCNPVPAPDVLETRDGWTLIPTQERIPVWRGLKSRDARTWVCRRRDGSIRCFFAPPGTS